jgi:hypothetical protein
VKISSVILLHYYLILTRLEVHFEDLSVNKFIPPVNCVGFFVSRPLYQLKLLERTISIVDMILKVRRSSVRNRRKINGHSPKILPENSSIHCSSASALEQVIVSRIQNDSSWMEELRFPSKKEEIG